MIFIDNKYTKWYNSIISNAKTRRAILDYTEKHHIVPKSLGGNNSKENLAVLSAREHFICHLLLPKMVEGKARSKMAYAFFRFRHKATNSKIFDKFRTAYGKLTAGENNRFYGKKHSNETKERLRQYALLRPGTRTGAIYSDELKQKLKDSRRKGLLDGSIIPWNKGIKQDLKLSCPHCGKVTNSKWTYTRYHGENCPNKKAA